MGIRLQRRLPPTLARGALAGAALLAAVACGPDAAVRGEPACHALRWDGASRRIPVVLIVNDTMRRDRTGAYGGPADTPAFDRFAREHLLFAQAYTQAPWTRPSIATLFTSLYPSQHGMTAHPSEGKQLLTALSEDHHTLAEAFRDAGYRTAAFVANPWMNPRLGFAQGFDHYEDAEHWRSRGSQLSRRALRWLSEVPEGEPFFLYLHYLDSHRPYPQLSLDEIRDHAEEIRADDRELSERAAWEIQRVVRVGAQDSLAAGLAERKLVLLEMAYDKGVERFDAALGLLIEGLARSWAGERAAVIVTSDHGEALFARGYGNHGLGLYDDEAAVPLAARLPGVEADEHPIRCLVGLIDLMPTLCHYLALPCPGPLFGRSLLPGADVPGREGRRFVVTEGVAGRPGHRSVRNASFKLLWQPLGAPDAGRGSPYSLYDMAADPGERDDLLARDAPGARARAEALQAALHDAVPPLAPPPGRPVELDVELRERLRALGYLEPAAP